MKFKRFLSGALIFSIAFVGLNANAMEEEVPQASLSERLNRVIYKFSPIFEDFIKAISNIPSAAWLQDISDAVDRNLCQKYHVNSLCLVKRKEIEDAYVNLIKKHHIGCCRVFAAYIGRLLDEQNIKYHIINVVGNNQLEDNHEVVFIPGVGVLDFFGDLNQNNSKLTVRPLEKFLKNTKWGYKNTITAGYINEYDENGYFKKQKDIGVFMKENNITSKYKFPLFCQTLITKTGRFMMSFFPRKEVEKVLKNSDCSDCKDLEDLAKHEKKGIYDILRDYLNITPRDFNFLGLQPQHGEL